MLSASSRNRASLSASAASARLRSVISSATTLMPRNVASGIFQRVPVGEPDTLCVTTVRSLAADLYACDGFAGSKNRLNDVLDLIGNLWNRISHRPADVVRNGNPADLGQMPVDLEISAVRGKEGKSDRGSFVQELQFGRLVDHVSIPVDWTSPPTQ
jgi:hypothetical protein